MNDLNDSQTEIAKTLDGMIVVDAGPGTGKTHTIVERYCNILSVPDMDPRDVMLLTFTNNAAAEMQERLEARLGRNVMVQATTFDAFCLDVVLDSAESVSGVLGFGEMLTRSAGLVQSRALNLEYFRNVYARFMKRHGDRYKGIQTVVGNRADDVFDLLERMMSLGIIPLPDYGWIGEGNTIEGDRSALLAQLRGMNGGDLLRAAVKDLDGDLPEWYSDDLETIPDDVLEDAVYEERKWMIWMVHDIYREYLRSSVADNRLTFAIVELFALAALYGDAGVRSRFSFRYVMIDEFQDTNELQLKIALLILKEHNLCAVGDWKQGIYGFRNVSIENIIGFGEKVAAARTELNRGTRRIPYPAVEPMRFSLRENYRSSQKIIDASFRALTIKASENEVMEDLSASIIPINASRDDIGDHTEFEILQASSADRELHLIAEQVSRYVSDPSYVIHDGVPRSPRYGDIAVLCRSNEMGRRIRDTMDSLGIPAFLQGEAKIMRTREAKLLLAWLRYVNSAGDRRGPAAIMADLGYTLDEIRGIQSRTAQMPRDIVGARERLVPKRRRLISLVSSVFSLYGLNNDITQSITSVISAAQEESLLTISDVIRLIEDDMRRSETYETDPALDRDAVTVQTMHKSKGLEYPIVIVAGLNRNAFPGHCVATKRFTIGPLTGIRVTDEYVSDGGYHRIRQSWRWNIVSATRRTEYDEQRRLLFVAVSRAKQYVTMTCHTPSRFMLGYGGPTPTEPTIGRVEPQDTGRRTERPEVTGHRPFKQELSVHDIMGPAADGGGKGPEYGNMVHDAALLMAMGREPRDDLEEIPVIRRILESVKDADVLTEVPCMLPLDDAIVKGVMDMVAVFPDRVEVHDYKTDIGDGNLQRYEMQLGIYANIAAAHFRRDAYGMIHFVSRPGGVAVKVDPMPTKRVAELVREWQTRSESGT